MVLSFYRDIVQKLVEEAAYNPEAADVLREIQSARPMPEEEKKPASVGWTRLDDLKFETDESKHLLGGKILPNQKMILISGLPKEGKTYIALEIASSVASGDRLFGRYEINRPGAVYFFDYENGADEIGIRMLRRGDVGRNLPVYLTFDRQNLSGEEGVALLENLPEPPRLVIVDSLRAAVPFKDENDASEAIRRLSAWTKWAHENATVIFLHHNNKMTQGEGILRISGTSAIPAVCDGCWIMKERRIASDDSRFWKVDVVGRAGMSGEIVLRMDSATCRISEVDDEDWRELTATTTQQERESLYIAAVEVARRLQTFTITELANALGRRPNIVSADVNRMIEAGIAERKGNRFSIKSSPLS